MNKFHAVSNLLIAALIIPTVLHGTGARAEEKIRVSAQGGSYDVCVKDVYFDAWEKDTGIKVEVTSPSYDLGVWRTQQEIGASEWDVATADPGLLHELVKNGWALPLDRALITRDGGLIDLPGLVPEPSTQLYGLPTELFSTVVTFNSKTFATETPKTWSDVFDQSKFHGKRMFSNMVVDFGVLEIALLADGVAPKDLYPLDLDRAFRKLDTIKSEILWYDFGTQQVALLQQGDAVLGAGWDGRVKALQRDGGTVEYSSHQAIVKPDLWVLPKGGNAQLGAKFLSFISDAERQAKFAGCIGYGPVLKNAYDLLPSNQTFTVDPKKTGDLVVWDAAYWAENGRQVTARFNEWLTR